MGLSVAPPQLSLEPLERDINESAAARDRWTCLSLPHRYLFFSYGANKLEYHLLADGGARGDTQTHF